MALPISSQGIQYTPPQKHGSPGPKIVPETAVLARQAQQHPLTLEEAKSAFLRALEGKNRAASTITAYAADLAHFLSWLRRNNIMATAPHQVQRADITDYLAHLAQQSLMGVSRARKLAAIREFFRFLGSNGSINKNPAQGIETSKKEKNGRVYLIPILLMRAVNSIRSW
jgi:site-specific recombinase XerD